jgi:hypothetical protein
LVMPDRSHVPCAASGWLANAKTTGTTSFRQTAGGLQYSGK